MKVLMGAALTVLGLGSAALVLCMTLEPTADELVKWLVYATAPAATLFVLLYGLTTTWWTTMIGRALLVSSFALALLLNLSAIFQTWGTDYLARDPIRVSVMVLIFLGAWLKLLALLSEKWRGHRDRRRRP